MAEYVLDNGEIKIKVDSHGAELRSLSDCKSGREYMWCGDAAYWGRVSPVLFPLVGSYRDGQCRHNGRLLRMSQHGFARDMEFMLTEQSGEEIWFCLTDKENTWENYPFAFSLEIGYRLSGRSVKVMWRVFNPSKEEMYFSIGGHPAFAVPAREKDRITCYLAFDGAEKLRVRGLKGGLAVKELHTLMLEKDGTLPVTEELFAQDALVIENSQTKKVQLLSGDKKPYLTVAFDAPLFGVWTPPGKNAPFICIEPWYGRCDREDFTGSLGEREWGNVLAAGKAFEAAYDILV